MILCSSKPLSQSKRYNGGKCASPVEVGQYDSAARREEGLVEFEKRLETIRLKAGKVRKESR